jgi:general secretion pathway protein M
MTREKLPQLWKKLLAKSGLANLDLREKLFLTGGGFFVVLFLGFQFVLLPYLSSKSNLEQSIARKEQELVKIRQLRAEYLKLKNQEGDVLSKIVNREPGFALFTFLERQANRVNLKKSIQYMKPSVTEIDDRMNEVRVDMKLQQISLESLANFLLLIESEGNVVFVKRISIQENGDSGGFLDSILEIATYESKG